MEVLKYKAKKSGRADKVLAEISGHTRSQVQLWLKEQRVSVKGQVIKANYKVKEYEEFLIQVPEPKSLNVTPERLPLELVYEDGDVAIINKPQGMVVHPSPGHADGTLVNALLYHLTDLSSMNGVIRPGIVHRIDKDTSGLLMVAKNNATHEQLAQQLKDKTTKRKYIALVHGTFSHTIGTIDAPIGRNKDNRKMQAVVKEGKKAVTHFKVLANFKEYALVSLQLETGRTHQIRVHMKYIGHPVAGDPLYGPKKTLVGKGQFLHAAMLGFTHPKTNQLMTFEVPMPQHFQETIRKLQKSLASK